MRPLRWILVTLSCGLFFGCGGTSPAPRPTAPAPQDAASYYPLERGWKWAYDVEKDGDNILAVYAVVERLPDTAFVQAGEERLVYAVLPEGVARRERLEIGDFLIKSPVRKDATWPIAGGTAKVTAVGKTVTVPAGSFDNCAVVEENRTEPTRVVRTTYAPGVGPILLEVRVHDANTGTFRTALRGQLRGVTRPGEDPLGPPGESHQAP